MRRTKIICTLGPATDDEQVLRSLMKNGMNVARLNFSHGNYAEHQKRIDMVKKLREELALPVALLLDTKGPEIRIRSMKNGGVELKAGQSFTLSAGDGEGDETGAYITYEYLYGDVKKGTTILIDDGLLELTVKEILGSDIVCIVKNSGHLGSNKSINVPGVSIRLPYMSEKDEQDIIFGIKNDFDFIAASFVRSKEDVLEVRRILEKNGGGTIRVISKIENGEGVKNFDEILKVTNGVMVARGDMGVEIPIEQIPGIQKDLIRKSRLGGKSIITATQMLDSMIRNPRPTRAEATDVANAIYDGTSAIMLSGETAVGKYPVESVITMHKIAVNAEMDINYFKRFVKFDSGITKNVTDAISHATCTTAHGLSAAAIITVTKSGHTGRMVSKYRPVCPIIAATPNKKAWRQMSIVWGVSPIIIEDGKTTDDIFEAAVNGALAEGFVKNADLVVISAGVPVGISGTTNILKVHIVGNVLVRGERVNHHNACGVLCVCKTEQEALSRFQDGDILVVPATSNALFDILKRAKGIITEEGGLTSHGAIVGMSLDIPVVCGVPQATDMLKSGTIVTIDSSRGLVFSGDEKNA